MGRGYWWTTIVVMISMSLGVSGQNFEVPAYTAISYQEPQGGSEAINMLNGDLNSIYHSRWGQVGIPDTIDVYFTERVQSINRIDYTPRLSGLNGVWTHVDVYYATREQPDVFLPIAEDVSWPADNNVKAIDLESAAINPHIIRIAVNQSASIHSSCAALTFYSDEDLLPSQDIDCTIPIENLLADVQQDELAQISINGSFASSFQPGENIERSFDGDFNTLYHSSWSATTFPVTLNYRLDGETPIDYLVYYPRSTGVNGFFGHVEIYYNTDESGPGNEFIHLMDFNFGQEGQPTRVDFPEGITPLNVQIVVLDGRGGFASCAQMELYTKKGDDADEGPYRDIFTDELYTDLKEGVDQSAIDTISNGFFRALAQCLHDGTYNRKFRYQSYEVYKPLSAVRQSLKVSNYNAFENPTGMVFSEGDTAVLFVRGIESGVPIFLRVRDFADEEQTSDRSYQLNNGINLIDIQAPGLGYITYFNNDLNLPDIDVHIATGLVNGYFDRFESDDEEWFGLLSGENYSKIDLRGEFTHLIYDKGALRFGSPLGGKTLLGQYDTIVDHQRMLMGMYKFPERAVKNRMLSLSGFSGGWYAGGLGIHLDLSWGVNSITNPNALGLWGIAHEFGHINQIRPGIRWHGTIEVTTNIYSTWTTLLMNYQQNPFTRLESERISVDGQSDPVEGGRINAFIEAINIRGESLKGAENYDVFKVLVPFYQLQLYYQMAGAARNAPTLSLDNPTPEYSEVDYANYFAIVAEMVRNADLDDMTPGELQLNYVRMTCDAVEEDLTDFFINTGFLKPINTVVDDYGERPFVITQAQVDETINYIKSKDYRSPASPVMHYISAHSLETYKHQRPLQGESGQGIEMQGGQAMSISHDVWQNAVAFETIDENGELKHIAIVGTGDVSNQSTLVRLNPEMDSVFAIGYDGERLLVYPEETVSTRDKYMDYQLLIIYPNPMTEGDFIQFGLEAQSENLEVTISSQQGSLLLHTSGDMTFITNQVNHLASGLPPGVYIFNVVDQRHNRHVARLVKQ